MTVYEYASSADEPAPFGFYGASAAAVREDQLLTVRDAAAFLKVNPATVYRLIERGELRAFRIGSGPNASIRIDPEAIGEMLARASAR